MDKITITNEEEKINKEKRRNKSVEDEAEADDQRRVSKVKVCLLYTSPSPRDGLLSRMPSSA